MPLFLVHITLIGNIVNILYLIGLSYTFDFLFFFFFLNFLFWTLKLIENCKICGLCSLSICTGYWILLIMHFSFENLSIYRTWSAVLKPSPNAFLVPMHTELFLPHSCDFVVQRCTLILFCGKNVPELSSKAPIWLGVLNLKFWG